MSGSVNKVILVGRLGKDPEVRTTNDGTRIANLTVATSESWKDKSSGERKEKTEWHRVSIWNDKLAEIAERYLRKGSKIYLCGALQTRKWTDQSGQDRYSTEVVLQGYRAQLVLLDGRENSPGGNSRDNNGGYQSASSSGPAPDFDDEIPF